MPLIGTFTIKEDIMFVRFITAAAIAAGALASVASMAQAGVPDPNDYVAVPCKDGTTQLGWFYLTDDIICLGHGGAADGRPATPTFQVKRAR